MDDSITNAPASTSGPTPGVAGPAQPPWLEPLVQAAHAAIDRLTRMVAPHAQHLDRVASSANESAHQRAAHAREVGHEWADSVRSRVREQPLVVVGGALAAGALVAWLLRSDE